MDELTNTNTGEISIIEDLARQAKYYAEGTAFNMLQLGRVLTQAKELVEHGEWEKWLAESETGLDARGAQYCMACFKKYGTDTKLAKLGPSKLKALLPLPDEEIEKLSETYDLDKMSVRAIKEEVRKAREEEQEKAREAVEAERQSGLLALARERESAEKRIAEAKAKAAEVPPEVLSDLRQKEEQIAELKEQIRDAEEAQAEATRAVMEGTEDIRKQGAEAVAERDKIRRELEAKNRMMESLQAEYEAMQAELLDMKSAIAKGDAERSSAEILSVDAVCDAVRVFMGQVGRVPFMHGTFATMDNRQREEYMEIILQVKDWADRSLDALRTIDGNGGMVE